VTILQARAGTGKLAPTGQIDEVISETAEKAGITWKQI
jgi:hypothetical protein